MKRILKRSARLILTAGVLGLIPVASAQEVLLPQLGSVPTAASPASRTAPMPAMLPEPGEIPAPPKVVPPAGDRNPMPVPRLSREAQTAASARTTPQPRVAVFATEQTSTPVDLLAVPTIPSSWGAETVKSSAPLSNKRAKIVPVASLPPASPRPTKAIGTPTKTPTAERKITLPPPPLTTEITPLQPISSAPVTPPGSVSPGIAKSVPKEVPATRAAQIPPVPVKPNQWPSAFVEQSPHTPPEVKPVVAIETAKIETAPQAGSGPLIPTLLQQKVTRVCGNLAKDVTIATRPDHIIAVQIRLVSPSAEQEVLDRLLKLPELAEPNVRLELE